MTGDPFRVYSAVGADGYPPEWHATIKHLVREQAGHRCVRCGHPYRNGEHGNGEWSECDRECHHGAPWRYWAMWGDRGEEGWITVEPPVPKYDEEGGLQHCVSEYRTEAHWRILTVHHLNGNKADCRWWNLAALCQRCHLRVQRVVVMERVWPWPHTDWFRVYAAGWYAHAYLGEDLSREETEARLDELLALERVV